MAALLAILAAAELVRPTAVPHKLRSHPNLTRTGGPLPLTTEQIEDLPPIVQPALGNIDGVRAFDRTSGRPLVSSAAIRGNGYVEVTGWCADPEIRSAGAGLLAIVDGSKRLDVSGGYGTARADVARFLGIAGAARTGFDVRLWGDAFGAGPHSLQFAVVAADGRGIFLFPTIVRVSVAARSAEATDVKLRAS